MPFQFIFVKADTPLERGIQYGQQARDKIKAGVESYQAYFARTSDKSWEEIIEYALSYEPVIRQRMPRVLEEAKGIAQGAGVTFGELMVLNCRYEITKFPKKEAQSVPKECTTAAVLPEAARDGKTYLIKNWDYRQSILDNIVLIHIEEEDGTRIMGLAEAGQMLREGFNSHGVGLVNNMIQSCWDTWGVGIPVTFLRRRVLASKSFEEAREILISSPRSVSNNMLLCHGSGQAVDIEATPKGPFFIHPRDGIITHANHIVTHPEMDPLPSPKNRDTRLDSLLRRCHGGIDADFIMECMRDHEYYPHSICAHVTPETADRDIMTVASIIVDFQAQTAHICAGPPCQGSYIPYRL